MKFKLFLFSIIALLLFGCKEKNHLIGTWVEKDSFTSPRIWEISQDSFLVRYWNHFNIHYKVKDDTFFFGSIEAYEKSRYEIVNGALKLYSIENDSLIVCLERYPYINYIDYFNSKKNLNVNLPAIKTRNINHHRLASVIVFDNDDINRFYLNGEKIKLDSIAHISIIEILKHVSLSERIFVEIYCDHEILLEDLRRLELELQKARLIKIRYVTQDSIGMLYNTYRKLPYMENGVYDSIMKDIIPPPPPKYPSITELNEFDVLCSISNNAIEVDGKLSTYEEFNDLLKKRIMSDNKSILVLNFEDNISYDKYLKKINWVLSVYDSVKEEYTQEMFGKGSIDELNEEEIYQVNKKAPVLIYFATKNEYQIFKESLLQK